MLLAGALVILIAYLNDVREVTLPRGCDSGECGERKKKPCELDRCD